MDNAGEVEMNNYRKEIKIISFLIILFFEILSAESKQLRVIKEWKFKNDEHARSLETDSEGRIYVVTENCTIRIYSPDRKLLSEFGGEGVKDGKFLNWPDILVDKSGYIYASDNWLKRIQKFDKNGNLIKKWELRGIEEGELLELIGIDSLGNIYVYHSKELRKLDSEGNFYSLIINEKALAKFKVDTSGNFYILDPIKKDITIHDGNGNKVDRIELPLQEIERKYGSLRKFPFLSMVVDEGNNIFVLLEDIQVILKISAYTKEIEVIEFETAHERRASQLKAVIKGGKYFYCVSSPNFEKEEYLQIYKLSE